MWRLSCRSDTVSPHRLDTGLGFRGAGSLLQGGCARRARGQPANRVLIFTRQDDHGIDALADPSLKAPVLSRASPEKRGPDGRRADPAHEARRRAAVHRPLGKEHRHDIVQPQDHRGPLPRTQGSQDRKEIEGHFGVLHLNDLRPLAKRRQKSLQRRRRQAGPEEPAGEVRPGRPISKMIPVAGNHFATPELLQAPHRAGGRLAVVPADEPHLMSGRQIGQVHVKRPARAIVRWVWHRGSEVEYAQHCPSHHCHRAVRRWTTRHREKPPPPGAAARQRPTAQRSEARPRPEPAQPSCVDHTERT